jgi:hypothetical protein
MFLYNTLWGFTPTFFGYKSYSKSGCAGADSFPGAVLSACVCMGREVPMYNFDGPAFWMIGLEKVPGLSVVGVGFTISYEFP